MFESIKRQKTKSLQNWLTQPNSKYLPVVIFDAYQQFIFDVIVFGNVFTFKADLQHCLSSLTVYV